MSDINEKTFWLLLKNYNICVPKLQRDYAQGRENNPTIKQIRESLVRDLFTALTEDKKLVLSFIYGATDINDDKEEMFIPIDGQQRLTTLFLIHLYIFKQASFVEGIKVLKKFSYKTRDTSNRFCQKICESDIDFSLTSIKKQILDFNWMTNTFLLDPTVMSMLVVLDEIHKQFSSVKLDFVSLKDVLIKDDCPISFLWLDLPDYKQTDDLYIKMNSRGKLLTDFEIFKAKLQNSDILGKVLGQNNTEAERIQFISRYNNQYAELFFKYFLEDFDEAMMDYYKSIIRDSYFCAVVRDGSIGQKQYREDYYKISEKNGSLFYQFILDGGFDYKRTEAPFVEGIKRADKILELFSSRKVNFDFKNTLNKEYFNEKQLFIDNHNKPLLEDDLIRHSLYSFLCRFGIPDTDERENAYCFWKRFVFNIVRNSRFEARREDICETMEFFDRILQQVVDCKEENILKSICIYDSLQNLKVPGAVKDKQILEEKEKAELMLLDNEWRRLILEAEKYFVSGQIGFVLDFSKINGKNDLNSFKEYYIKLKDILTGTLSLKSNIDIVLFEKCLLCMPDDTSEEMGHLIKQSNSTTSKGFTMGIFKELLDYSTVQNAKMIFKHLIDSIPDVSNANLYLNRIINDVDESKFSNKQKWKIPFIKNTLFSAELGNDRFSNRIDFSQDNNVILLLTKTTVRAKSMDLNTFLLYLDLKNATTKDTELSLAATSDLEDSTGFPLRYIEIDGINIGYRHRDNNFVWKDVNGETVMSKDLIIQKIKKL